MRKEDKEALTKDEYITALEKDCGLKARRIAILIAIRDKNKDTIRDLRVLNARLVARADNKA